jgi:hypothetical protein
VTGRPVIVTMRDVRATKGCARGARAFAQRHGLDWTDFLENGVDATVLEATGDHMALQLAAHARKRAEAGRG